MVATHLSRKWTINFSYYGPDVTQCVIERVTSEGPLGVGIGESTCHPGDNFEKETGRRLALKSALGSTTEFTPLTGFNPAWMSPALRERRRAVWNAYHQRSERTANRVQ